MANSEGKQMTPIGLVCSTVIYHDVDVFRALDLIALDGFRKIELVVVPKFCPHFDLNSSDESQVERF